MSSVGLINDSGKEFNIESKVSSVSLINDKWEII